MRKGLHWQEDAPRQSSDAEVITTALAATLFFGNNQKARAALHQTGLIPLRLGKSRFCRRLHQVGDLIARVFLLLGLALKEVNASPRYLVDSFPVPLCDNLRTKRSRLVPLNEALRGKNASKRRFFYGVRVVVVTTESGLPVEFAFLPGAAFDVRAYNNLPLVLPPGSELHGDTAYVSQELEGLARELDGLHIHPCLRGDRVRRERPEVEARRQILRHPIEGFFSGIVSHFGHHVHAVAFRGFQLKLVLALLSYTLNKAYN